MLPLHEVVVVVVVVVVVGGTASFSLNGLVRRIFSFVVALDNNDDSSLMNSNSFLSLLRRLLGK